MIIGYARTSTVEQLAGFEAQLEELKKSGCEKLFQEQVSSIAQRAQLEAAIDFAREGDVFVVTKLDRLARSVARLLEIINILEKKKVGLKILNMGIDTQTPTGKMMLTMLGSVAQFEREIMLERQKEGIAKAQAAGKFRGRKPYSKQKRQEVLLLIANGMPKAQAARQLGIGETTLYRILKENKQNG